MPYFVLFFGVTSWIAQGGGYEYQGMVERELIYALINGKSWKLTAERVKELQQSCVTKACRESIRVP